MSFRYSRSFIGFTVIIGLVLATGLTMPAAAQPGGHRMTPTEIDTEHVEHMIDLEGCRLHAKVYGEGGPTVVLLNGIRAEQWYWHPIIPALAGITTVVTYDRPGYGKSEIGTAPCHALQAADDLQALLTELDVPKPYVVVGHSYGCRVARLFAANHPIDVGAILLEDGQHPGILEAQRAVLTGDDLAHIEQMVATMSATENPRTEFDYIMVSTEQSLNCGPLPHVPYTVMIAADRANSAPPMFSPEGREALIRVGKELQKELVALVPDGKEVIVEGAGHIIHNDKPEAVVGEISALVEQVRLRAP